MEMRVVKPREIDDVLVNPGMGFTTFQRFNGELLNPGKRWSEVGPESFFGVTGGENTDYPPTSLAYFRWYWNQIEPERGEYRWDIIDGALSAASRCGQRLAIRVMPHNGVQTVPDWFRRIGGGTYVERGKVKYWIPDYADPLYLAYMNQLITELGRRYDGHPNLDSVDIATLGHWGEWHASGPNGQSLMPLFAIKKEVIDCYLHAFQHTPLLMQDDVEGLRYAVQRGTGWRADCLGDMRDGWCHMLDQYPQLIVRACAQDAWKYAPVSLETCWVMGHWRDQGWDVKEIFRNALKWHVTSVNAKSSAVPEEWRSEVNAFMKRMGYRFVLRRFAYPASLRPYGPLPVEMYWENIGVAPIYRPYKLALRLRGEGRSWVVVTRAKVTDWLPGDVVYDDTLQVPKDIQPGAYEISIGMLSPFTDEPEIKLAIAGRDGDGWYSVGNTVVSRSS